MSDTEVIQNNQQEMWAVVELMGHGRTAGLIRTSDIGSLLRVDVPVEDGYRTEYYGESAIYSIKVVSEEIARAYALPTRNIVAYDEPIVPRQQYEEALQLARRNNEEMQRQINELQRRLTAVQALPSPTESECRNCGNNWRSLTPDGLCANCIEVISDYDRMDEDEFDDDNA